MAEVCFDLNHKEFQEQYDYNQQQCFLTVNKQKITQAQNQHFCNDTLARLLSCAENYAAKFNPNIKKQYEYYDPFNSSNKNKLDLKIQFMLQINLFVISFQDFNEEYNEYIFPENKTKEEIINELMEWQEIVDDEDKDFYETLIDLLNGKNVKLYMDEIDKIVKNSPEDANPKIFFDTIPGLRYDHDMRKKKTKQEFMKNGKYSENFQLNKKPENNPIYEQIKKNRENSQKTKTSSSIPVNELPEVKSNTDSDDSDSEVTCPFCIIF